MKRNTTDVLRRGFDNTLANWQLIGIRIAENFLFLLLIIVSIVAAVVPIAVAAGLTTFDPGSSSDPGEAMLMIFVQHWPLILYILVIVTVVLGLLIAIHSFVDAGCAKVFVDGERAAARASVAGRAAFSAFNIDRWLQGGRASWWSVFWIYNLAWGVAGVIMLLPLMATLAGILAVTENSARIVMACGGLVFTVLVVVPVAIVTAIWTQKAIVVAVSRAAAAREALRASWREMRADFSRHFAVAFILFAITIGGSAMISLFGAPMQFGKVLQSPYLGLAFAPVQVISSFAQAIFSAAIGLWMLASFVALTEER